VAIIHLCIYPYEIIGVGWLAFPPLKIRTRARWILRCGFLGEVQEGVVCGMTGKCLLLQGTSRPAKMSPTSDSATNPALRLPTLSGTGRPAKMIPGHRRMGLLRNKRVIRFKMKAKFGSLTLKIP